jgi:four helix bundle protein
MTRAKQFEDLEVRQKPKELTNLIYDYSSSAAFSRDFGLHDQIRRAAVPVMSNIAEGFESQAQVMFIQIPGRAKGSADELRAQLNIARDQSYLTDEQFTPAYLCAEICANQLARFIQYLETQPNSRRVL